MKLAEELSPVMDPVQLPQLETRYLKDFQTTE